MKLGNKTLIYSERHTHERGVGDVTAVKSLGELMSHFRQAIVATLLAEPLTLGIIHVYALTSNSEDVEVEKFYEEVEKAKGYLKCQDIIMITGDFNEKVRDESLENVVGPSGIGTVNERGSRLIECTKSRILPSHGIKTILGDGRLGRAPVIEVETK
ncbi:craniofacial development protein 2-like protein [Plakobranchus ocellatus]|uniref:Craniofacial development protein 2-like protein n=1 Tax=Plakobranchus ocellatus TaxID=259542 RepID=A0AAV3ZKI8_9GAST|nr:craniofacial development protein 2-like protein [Plakobranchus ocellatus]